MRCICGNDPIQATGQSCKNQSLKNKTKQNTYKWCLNKCFIFKTSQHTNKHSFTLVVCFKISSKWLQIPFVTKPKSRARQEAWLWLIYWGIEYPKTTRYIPHSNYQIWMISHMKEQTSQSWRLHGGDSSLLSIFFQMILAGWHFWARICWLAAAAGTCLLELISLLFLSLPVTGSLSGHTLVHLPGGGEETER